MSSEVHTLLTDFITNHKLQTCLLRWISVLSLQTYYRHDFDMPRQDSCFNQLNLTLQNNILQK